jgi:hypothetical protein
MSKCRRRGTWDSLYIEAGKGIRMDAEKVKAIIEWETPRTVKGV